MSERIVVDPITRIEGHLRIEAEVKDGRITDAWSAGTMVRGLEIILKGRDPRDAWAFCERVCGVCTTMHALASVRAVEDSLEIAVPPNGELIRNLMYCTQFMHDHVVHFYHLHALDWVDVVSALKADPELKAIPVIAVTAFAMKGDEERIREGGCEAYLSKPISVAKFLETVRQFAPLP